MDKKIRNAIFEQIQKEPFSEKFGIKLIDVQDGCALVEMPFTEDMENMFGMAHGGAIFSLMDAAFEVASNSHGTMALALSMNINDESNNYKDDRRERNEYNIDGLGQIINELLVFTAQFIKNIRG